MIEFFKQTFLFRNIDDAEIRRFISCAEPQIRCFERGDQIFTPECFEKKLGFVISGECEVRRMHEDTSCLILNALKKYDSFGIISIFSNTAEYPSYIYASRKCEVCFIKSEDLIRLIESDKRVALNLINFLTTKIEFLNEKIRTFASVSVEKKLASYLLSEYKKNGLQKFILNKKHTAETIGAGRASLYRALNALEAQNLVQIDNKIIFINDLVGLERISK